MGHYRLYFLDGFSGHITRFMELEAQGDAAAVSLAHKSSAATPMELWCGHRKVMRWEADTPPSTRTVSLSSPSELRSNASLPPVRKAEPNGAL